MTEPAWIRMIPDEEADEALNSVFDLARTPHGTLDNVMRVHSLRPATMAGHVTLYRSVLHSEDNTVPFWFLETVASYVSILNKCAYSLLHHWANASRLMYDPERAQTLRAALDNGRPEDAFEGKELEGRIAGANRVGLFVRFEEPYLDGFAPAALLPQDYWRLSRDGMSMDGRSSGMSYRIGDSVTARIREVEVATGSVTLELSPPEGGLRRKRGGKRLIKKRRR